FEKLVEESMKNIEMLKNAHAKGLPEEPQRDKTGTVKGTSSPEFKEQFRLNISRTHRGFKRVIQSKGINYRWKVGGDGKDQRASLRSGPAADDGEVVCSGAGVIAFSSRETEGAIKPHGVFFLCLHKAPSPQSKPKHESSSRSSHPDNSPPQYNLHSFSLLNYDKERLERKVCVIPACPPHLFTQGLVAHYCGLAVCRLPEKPSRTPV
ncbi:hypothetical protein GOODEAATRI_021264, partial [Goodea atripinnis]